jgi:pyridoxal 5'-phosphate synthase pdxT subunit
VAGEDILAGVEAAPTVGVLALQGAFREHVSILKKLGARAVEVRLAEHLSGLDGLIIPGGESTTMGKLMEEYGLTAPLRAFAENHPVFGTCAGLIMLATRTTDTNQPLLGVLDTTVRRNAFGAQVRSFEAPVELELPGAGPGPFPGIFIRAPWVEELGPGVEVIATCEGHVVGVRQGSILGVAFHPELTEDPRLHVYFLRTVAA